MKILVMGLGRIGRQVASRLSAEFQVEGYDVSESARAEAEKLGLMTHSSIEEIAKADKPGSRIFWLLLPAGGAIDELLDSKTLGLTSGDTVIDGGNSHYQDSIRRHQTLQRRGIRFLDVGTSGGVWGEREGFCLMVGGNKHDFETMEPALKRLAKEGYAYVGGAGAGHYVKMVHNAIEYGMLQVLGEGFWLLKESDYSLDLKKVSELWNHGSVIRGWLLTLTERVLSNPKTFARVSDEIGGGETGLWAITEAMNKKIPIPLITLSLTERYSSTREENFGHKLIAALRKEFGGHSVKNT